MDLERLYEFMCLGFNGRISTKTRVLLERYIR
jgi:hypothetical protein